MSNALSGSSRSFSSSLFRGHVAFLFFAIATVASAALGDGADKIEEAYGVIAQRHLLDNGAVQILYQKDRYYYLVTFARGVSVAEEYSRVDRANLSDKEVARFLKMNANRQMTSSREGGTLIVKVRK